MKPSEVIREARSVLFERGWNRNGLYEADDGSVCVVGALQVAGGTNRHEAPVYEAWLVCEGLNNDIRGYDSCVAFFNDRVASSLDEVLEFLDKAEKIAEQREVGE